MVTMGVPHGTRINDISLLNQKTAIVDLIGSSFRDMLKPSQRPSFCVEMSCSWKESNDSRPTILNIFSPASSNAAVPLNFKHFINLLFFDAVQSRVFPEKNTCQHVLCPVPGRAASWGRHMHRFVAVKTRSDRGCAVDYLLQNALQFAGHERFEKNALAKGGYRTYP